MNSIEGSESMNLGGGSEKSTGEGSERVNPNPARIPIPKPNTVRIRIMGGRRFQANFQVLTMLDTIMIPIGDIRAQSIGPNVLDSAGCLIKVGMKF